MASSGHLCGSVIQYISQIYSLHPLWLPKCNSQYLWTYLVISIPSCHTKCSFGCLLHAHVPAVQHIARVGTFPLFILHFFVISSRYFLVHPAPPFQLIPLNFDSYVLGPWVRWVYKSPSGKWRFICIFRACFSRKHFLQTSHSNGFSPVWVFICFCSPCLVSNAIPQFCKLHKYASTPSCQRLWALVWFIFSNIFPQPGLLHTSFSRLWVFLCLFRYPCCMKVILHTSHSYFLSTIWVNVCCSSLLESLNRISQPGHSQTNLLFPSCHRKWAFSWDGLLYDFPQFGLLHM